ncbi:GNAT family N-acetyltransferase [Conexibacter arvalis]|uniref:RimJ/RimL family protein N-acetyltransferase n=1 Tax=Conexibacter arvalis TaxID=912552 RepID=A0A840IEI7_9ACTN|nr:GNAT family N-acetyltransferase [Conexibacter arvalis]MBB4663232.1 RimJ/RimL family protein N-acetyltransferase [Conexibacter arvalis]
MGAARDSGRVLGAGGRVLGTARAAGASAGADAGGSAGAFPSSLAAPLLTARLELRPWRDDAADLDAYAALCADPDVMRHIGAGEPLTRAQAAAQLTRFAEHWERHGYGLRAAVLRDSGELAGFVGVARAGQPGVRPGDVEIGWRLARRFWGRGLATEGALAVRDHAFARLRLARLVAFVRPANAASIAVMRKLGMEPLRDATCSFGRPMRIFALDNPLAAGRSAAGPSGDRPAPAPPSASGPPPTGRPADADR